MMRKRQAVVPHRQTYRRASSAAAAAEVRAVLRDTLGKTIAWAIERATLDGWQPMRIKAHLQLV